MDAAISNRAKLLSTVFITATPKGGAGKTETAECLEASITLGGATCALVDVDDGNRGIARRVGPGNVIKLNWATPVTGAVDWVAQHANQADTMIFDLGAGIDSSDLPVMAFMGSAWRMLADRGARIIICAVVSTNAPTSAFIDRIDRKFGSLGELIIVCNNQDGSREYPAELAALHQPKVHLDQIPGGIQAVRMSRRERLSSVLLDPSPDHTIAGAMMARRVLRFARQPIVRRFVSDGAVDTLLRLSKPAPQHLRYSVSTRAHATDAIIQQNARVMTAELALLNRLSDDAAILARAHEFRRQHAAFHTLIHP